jgi:predicted small metal-binding protein
MARKWSCNEHDCGTEIRADSMEELIEQVNAHMAEAHDSYELEEMIEDASVEVADDA